MGDVRVGKGKRTSIILVIIGISVVLFSLFSRLQVAAGAQEGPSVAGILLEGGSLDEKREVIQEEVLHWKQGSPIRLESDYETIYVDRSLFHFQIEETLAAFEEKTKRRLSNFFLKPTNVQVPLVVRVDENDEAIRDWPERINKEVMINKLIALASELQENEVEIVYQTEPSREMETTAEVTVSLPQLSETIVQSISENLTGTLIEKESTFSFLDAVTIPGGSEEFEEELNAVATGLYRLFLQTNVDIAEHHSQGSVPDYGEPGVEVLVDRLGEKDFIVSNSNDYAYLLETEVDAHAIHLSLKTFPLDVTYSFYTDNEKHIEPRTIYRYTTDLRPGEEEYVQVGKNGLHIELYQEERTEDGGLRNVKLVSRTYYPPTPEIILRSIHEEEEGQGTTEQGQNDDENGAVIEDGEWIEELPDEINEDAPDMIDDEIEDMLNEMKELYCEQRNNTIKTEENGDEESFIWDICETDDIQFYDVLMNYFVLDYLFHQLKWSDWRLPLLEEIVAEGRDFSWPEKD